MSFAYGVSLGIFAWAPSAIAQDASAPNVSLRTGTVGLQRALDELTRQSGMRIEAIPALRGEIVIIDVEDAPLFDVLRRLTDVVGAAWERTNDGYRMVVGPSLERELRERETAERARHIQTYLEGRARNVQPMTDEQIRTLVENSARVQENLLGGNLRSIQQFVVDGRTGTGPGERLIVSLLHAIGATTLAQIAVDQRMVFATNPTRMQVALPASAGPALNQFLQEHNRVAAMVQERGRPTQETTRSVSISIAGGVDLNARPLSRLGKVWLAVARDSNSQGLQVSLVVSDPEGTEVARSETMLPIQMTTAATSLNLPEPRKEIELSPLAREFVELGQQRTPSIGDVWMGGGATEVRMMVQNSAAGAVSLDLTPSRPAPNISEAWQARLLAPTAHEPLGFVFGEALIQASRSQGFQLVACLSDHLLTNPRLQAQLVNSQNAAAVLGVFATEPGTAVSQDDRWLTVGPKFPLDARAQRIDRAVLERALASALRLGRLSLDDLANYAVAQPSYRALQSLDATYFEILRGRIADGELMRQHAGQRPMLRVYASLNPAQRNTLAQGGFVPLSGLGQNAGAAIRQMVYGASRFASLHVETDGPAHPILRSLKLMGPQDEPTEVLPMGIPTYGVLTLVVHEQAAALCINSRTGASRIMTAQQIGGQMGLAEQQSSLAGRGPQFDFDRFRPAVVRQLDFTFRFTENISSRQQLTDRGAIGGSSQGVPLSQMPPGFLEQVERARSAVRNIRFEVDGVRIGGGSPPPHP